jgi:hypothetical protein
VLTTCGGTAVVDPGGACAAGGFCLCRAACKGLPSAATPDKLGSLGDYLCDSADCPAHHTCAVTAWSAKESLYYGKCYFACENVGDCLPSNPKIANLDCEVPPYRETKRPGVCAPFAHDLCVVQSSAYDCRTQNMEYVISCDGTSPPDHPFQVHIGAP